MTHALDLTVAYEGFSAECERCQRPADLMDGMVRGCKVHILIRRIALPAEGDDVAAWLASQWAEKERALARWENDGSFEAERLELPLPAWPLLGALVAYTTTAAALSAGAVLSGIQLYRLAVGDFR